MALALAATFLPVTITVLTTDYAVPGRGWREARERGAGLVPPAPPFLATRARRR
ncbi:hypothetical protein GCM10010446_13580 [Streptomyces enissocaesilis]|uniref:Uncharacterized protein n=1 Tax=Streptomyces enissocaesilis TaxID=332589 RepID=A0ABP6JFM1_9ACTN